MMHGRKNIKFSMTVVLMYYILENVYISSSCISFKVYFQASYHIRAHK
jgi:hypothetical protein